MTLFPLLTAQLNHRNPIAPQSLRVWNANPAGCRRECNRLPCRYHLYPAHGLRQPFHPNVFCRRVHRKQENAVSRSVVRNDASQKPSWCFAVKTMYRWPHLRAKSIHCSGSNLTGLKRSDNARYSASEISPVGTMIWPGCFHTRHRVQSPVNEHPKLCLALPSQWVRHAAQCADRAQLHGQRSSSHPRQKYSSALPHLRLPEKTNLPMLFHK